MTHLSAFSPVIASILLIPEETEFSLIILKKPISPVLLTWVPPHNSIDQYDFSLPSLSPKDTTLTRLPYFSPNNAVAPSFFESLIFISRIITLVFSRIILLTSFSSLNRSSDLIELEWLKSNLNLSGETKEPFWEMWLPNKSFNTWCKIWVDEWLQDVKFLLIISTFKETWSSFFKTPRVTFILCK